MDTVPPVIVITTPTDSDAYATAATNVSLGGSAVDNEGVAAVAWTNAATGLSGPCFGTTTWMVSGVSLAAGENEITVTVSDAAGNSAQAVITVTWGDDVPPEVTVTAPASVTNLLRATLVTLEGTASDNMGVEVVTVSNGADGKVYTAAGTDSWKAEDIPLAAGMNILTVCALDGFGNAGTAVVVVRVVKVDGDYGFGPTVVYLSSADRRRNTLLIAARDPAPITATVFNMRGVEVAVVKGDTGIVEWDGCVDGSDRKAGAGVYFVKVTGAAAGIFKIVVVK